MWDYARRADPDQDMQHNVGQPDRMSLDAASLFGLDERLPMIRSNQVWQSFVVYLAKHKCV